jgi:neutral ceramidase
MKVLINRRKFFRDTSFSATGIMLGISLVKLPFSSNQKSASDDTSGEIMKAGFFEKDITPPVGGFLDGFDGRTMPSEGVTDPLFLRILALEDSRGENVVLVTADLIGFPIDMSWRIKKWAETHLGLKSSSVILNSSHTHCGPVLTLDSAYPRWKVDIYYVDRLESTVCQGIQSAVENLAPSIVKYGSFSSDLGIDRRLPKPDKDGKMVWDWGPYEQGYYDPEMSVLAVYDETAESLKGILYSYGCHPTARGGQNISADFPGAVSRGLKKNLGENVYTLFTQGAGGNVKPRIYDQEKKSFKTPSQEELDTFGQKYADQISNYLQSGNMKEIPLELASAEKEFDIPFDLKRVPEEKILQEYSEKDNSNYHNIAYKLWSRQLLEQQRTNSIPHDYRMHLTKINLNRDIQIIGLSSEVVAGVARMVKDLYPDKNTIFFGYCTYNRLYIPTSNIIEEGGYEGDYSMVYCLAPAPFVKEIDDIIKKEVLSLKIGKKMI